MFLKVVHVKVTYGHLFNFFVTCRSLTYATRLFLCSFCNAVTYHRTTNVHQWSTMDMCTNTVMNATENKKYDKRQMYIYLRCSF